MLSLLRLILIDKFVKLTNESLPIVVSLFFNYTMLYHERLFPSIVFPRQIYRIYRRIAKESNLSWPVRGIALFCLNSVRELQRESRGDSRYRSLEIGRLRNGGNGFRVSVDRKMLARPGMNCSQGSLCLASHRFRLISCSIAPESGSSAQTFKLRRGPGCSRRFGADFDPIIQTRHSFRSSRF